MTSETLKPFISSPSMSNYVSNPKRHILLIGLSVLFSLIIAGIFGFTIWNTVRVGQLQNEVDSLHKLLDNMQKKLGLDYLDDLNDFEKAYSSSNDLLDDIDDDDDDEDSTSDENGDLLDFESDDYNEEDDFDFEASGDDNYDDVGNEDNNDDKLLDDFERYMGSKKRKSRSISEVNGVPIYRESYALRRNKTGGPDDEKIARYLLNKKPSPTLRYDWNDKIPQRTVHQMKSEEKYMEARAGPETVVRLSPHMYNGKQHNIVHHRGHHHEKNINNHVGNRIDNIRDENQQQQQKVHNIRPMLKNGGRLRGKSHGGVLAVHYNLNRMPVKGNYRKDTNTLESHNDDSIYILLPQKWSNNNRMDEAFTTANGIVTIKESGIYFIYAQIFYHNNQDRNGYLIYHNSRPLAQCLSSTPDKLDRANTCYTSSAIYLQKDDTIHMKDLHKDIHSAVFGNAKSFLGLIRLGNPIEYNKSNHFI